MLLLMVTEQLKNNDEVLFFNCLWKNNYGSMYKNAYCILSDDTLAEDAVAEAFMGVLRFIPRLMEEDEKYLHSYLNKCARNAACNIAKKRGRINYTELLPEEEDEASYGLGADAFEELCVKISKEKIGEALYSMPPLLRDILVMRFVEECSIAQISQKHNMTAKQVYALIKKAKARFALEYKKRQEK